MSSNKKVLGVIPSRYGSTRFEGKPLVDIQGKTMVQRVYEQALKSKLSFVVVATDHQGIYDEVKRFGGNVVMTPSELPSGTDRAAYTLTLLEEQFDYVVNVQGDEPFIAPEMINEVIDLISTDACDIATLCNLVQDKATLFDVNSPKVVRDVNQNAMYFSRQPIPYLRGLDEENWLANHDYFKHVGLYAYTTKALEAVCKLPVSKTEKAESLEQLRWLENGFKIKVGVSEYTSLGIDTPEQLVVAQEYALKF